MVVKTSIATNKFDHYTVSLMVTDGQGMLILDILTHPMVIG